MVATATRLEPSGMLFLYYIFLNYTNEYLKLLCLQMQMSGAVGKGDGLGINGGSRRVGLELSGTFFLLLFIYLFLYLLAVRLCLGIDNVIEQPPCTISRTNRI